MNTKKINLQILSDFIADLFKKYPPNISKNLLIIFHEINSRFHDIVKLPKFQKIFTQNPQELAENILLQKDKLSELFRKAYKILLSSENQNKWFDRDIGVSDYQELMRHRIEVGNFNDMEDTYHELFSKAIKNELEEEFLILNKIIEKFKEQIRKAEKRKSEDDKTFLRNAKCYYHDFFVCNDFYQKDESGEYRSSPFYFEPCFTISRSDKPSKDFWKRVHFVHFCLFGESCPSLTVEEHRFKGLSLIDTEPEKVRWRKKHAETLGQHYEEPDIVSLDMIKKLKKDPRQYHTRYVPTYLIFLAKQVHSFIWPGYIGWGKLLKIMRQYKITPEEITRAFESSYESYKKMLERLERLKVLGNQRENLRSGKSK